MFLLNDQNWKHILRLKEEMRSLLKWIYSIIYLHKDVFGAGHLIAYLLELKSRNPMNLMLQRCKNEELVFIILWHAYA